MRVTHAIGLVLVVATVTAACGGTTTKRSDPPVLVPWTRVGDIRLGEAFKQVDAEYGRQRGRGYRLHGGLLSAGSYVPGNRITVIDVTSRYYRTKSGFGVGSTFPKRWRRDFFWNGINKGSPCHCWVKVGTGKRSLPPIGNNFLKPWVIVYISHGRVSDILLSSKYVD